MYQSAQAAQDSNREHVSIVAAMVAKDEAKAVHLMEEHLFNVVSSLTLDRKPPSHNVTEVFESSYLATMEAHLETMQSPL
jgi:FCD domain